jgi:cell division protein FtsB
MLFSHTTNVVATWITILVAVAGGVSWATSNADAITQATKDVGAQSAKIEPMGQDVAVLKSQMSTMRDDIAEIKASQRDQAAAAREILGRLPKK